MMMHQEQERQKKEADLRKKKVKDLILPILFSESENTLDGIIMANTLAQAVENTVRAKLFQAKISEYDKDLAQATGGKPRYQKILDVLKDEKVSDAIALLATLKGMVNEGMDKKFSKVPLKEFLGELENKILIP
jgi:hypothetical protein